MSNNRQAIFDGTVNNRSYSLISLDGVLRIHLHILSGAYDTIWLHARSPIFVKEGYQAIYPVNYPTGLAPNESVTLDIPMATAEMATLHWTFDNPLSMLTDYRDSVFLIKNDTMVFTLS